MAPPGSLCAPLSASDLVPAGVVLPAVTMVFCMADGGKTYASKHRRDARDVHAQLLATMRSVLRQARGKFATHLFITDDLIRSD